jgi:hypothetical protein
MLGEGSARLYSVVDWRGRLDDFAAMTRLHLLQANYNHSWWGEKLRDLSPPGDLLPRTIRRRRRRNKEEVRTYLSLPLLSMIPSHLPVTYGPSGWVSTKSGPTPSCLLKTSETK